MNARTPSALVLAASLAVASHASAHGGMYRAPGDALPPSSSSSSGSGGSGGSGSGSAPATGAPAGAPSAGGSTGPSARTAATSAGPAGLAASGAALEEDLTRWAHYWEFRKDSYLRLKAAVHDPGVTKLSDTFYMGSGPRAGVDSLRPSRSQICDEIVPALHRALEATQQRDITSACLVALAKIGHEDTRYHSLLPVLRARLNSRDQEIRETAALSLGISQRPAAIPTLIALLQDTDEGRKLCDRAQVDDRTRSFAAYGLGLVAWASSSAGVKSVALEALKSVLDDDSIAGMNVHVAVVNAIGLLNPGAAGQRAADVRDAALAVLEEFFERDLGVGRQLVQAHVPTAVASLLVGETDEEQREAWAKRFVKVLRSQKIRQQGARRNLSLPQSVTLALGELARPNHAGSRDAWISKALMAAFRDRSDAQAGYFALAAIGRIGGSVNREFLLGELRSGSKALEKPWAALALGLLENRRLATEGPSGVADVEITAAILGQIESVKNPDALGAFAVALGLAQARDAAPVLRKLLDEHRHQDEFAGYLCIGLGLMGDRESVDRIREIVATSTRRPRLLVQAAVALGRLGDKGAAVQLMDQMAATQQNVAVLASLAFAVGQIGDRRTVQPLIDLVEDEARTDLARAFAVVALGGVADKELEPWNAKIGRQVNYRASVETLTNQASGILDIL